MPNVKCQWTGCIHNKEEICEYDGEITLLGDSLTKWSDDLEYTTDHSFLICNRYNSPNAAHDGYITGSGTVGVNLKCSACNHIWTDWGEYAEIDMREIVDAANNESVGQFECPACDMFAIFTKEVADNV